MFFLVAQVVNEGDLSTRYDISSADLQVVEATDATAAADMVKERGLNFFVFPLQDPTLVGRDDPNNPPAPRTKPNR